MRKPRRVWVWVFLLSWLPAAGLSEAAPNDQVTRPQPAAAEPKNSPKTGKQPDLIKNMKPEPKPAPKVELKADKRPDLKTEKKPDPKPAVKAELNAEKKLDLKTVKKPAPKAVPADDEDEAPVAKKAVKKKEKKEKKPAQHAAPPPPVAKTPPLDEAQTLLAQAREKEGAGDIGACLQLLARFINVFPGHQERAATLMRMGRLARDRGQADKAMQIFSLGASLYPDSLMAADARWQTANLEFSQDLKETDPLAAFKNFLHKAALLNAPLEQLREPLHWGWQAVEKAVRKKSPCPVQLVEEVLAIWEAHGDGTQPPEAALLVGELLMENGLHEVAWGYLQLARDQGTPAVRARAMVALLEAAWESRDLQEFAGVSKLWREKPPEVTPALSQRLKKLPLPAEFLAARPGVSPERKPEEDAVASLLDWWSGKTPDASSQALLLTCLEHFLSRPLSGVMKERLQGQLARLEWSQGNFSRAARIYQELLAGRGGDASTAFYHDRLALARLKSRQPEEALEIYHGLGQREDHFWQMLSRTRLADVELGRLQAEPLPND